MREIARSPLISLAPRNDSTSSLTQIRSSLFADAPKTTKNPTHRNANQLWLRLSVPSLTAWRAPLRGGALARSRGKPSTPDFLYFGTSPRGLGIAISGEA